MSSQLQIKMDGVWQDIEAEDFDFWRGLGYEIRAKKLTVVPYETPVEPEYMRYQYRWLKSPETWYEQRKDNHDICVEQLTRENDPRTDIQVRVLKLVQVGEIIGPKIKDKKVNSA